MSTELASMSDVELDALSMELTAARAEAEAQFKGRQLAVNAELDRRRVQAAAAAVPPEVRAAILAAGSEG